MSDFLPLLPQNIPHVLKGGHWCVWEAVPVPGRLGKFDKVPCHPGGWRISTKEPSAWSDFESCVTAAGDSRFKGIGRLVDADEDLLFLDFDNCVSAESIHEDVESWVRRFNSYVEYSPSGNGLRMVLQKPVGLERDLINNEAKVEAYCGGAARFLTFTGQVIHNAPNIVTAAKPDDWAAFSALFAPKEVESSVDPDMPEMLAPEDTPNFETLNLPEKVKGWLREGFDSADDRSKALAHTTHELYRNCLNDQQVFSLLFNNKEAYGVARCHRRDESRIPDYLWRHHCLKARGSNPLTGFDGLETEKPSVHKRFSRIDRFRDVYGPQEWLVQDFIPERTIGVLFGDPGSYKSYMAMDIGLSVAAGEACLDRETGQGCVFYLAGEGQETLTDRADAWAQNKRRTVDGMPFYVSHEGEELTEAGGQKQLCEYLDLCAQEAGPIKLLIVDTLAKNFGPKDENSNADMERFLAPLEAIKTKYQCTVLIVHHTGHQNKERSRGAMALRGGISYEFRISRDDLNDLVNFDCTKMRGAKEPERQYLETKTIFFDDPIESERDPNLVLVKSAGPAAEGLPHPGEALKGKQKRVFEVIQEQQPVDRDTLCEMLVDEEGLFETRKRLSVAIGHLKTKELLFEAEGKLSPA